MATVDQPSTSSISSEALGRLNCFTDGFDEIIYEIAESIAKQRADKAGLPQSPLCVEVQDVELAASQVIERLRELVQSGKVPQEIERIIKDMDDCLFGSSGPRPEK